MKISYDLSKLDWKLSGWIPHLWRMDKTMEIGASTQAEIPAIPANVPGSVQQALRDAGIIPDWNIGLNYRDCEWVENRHWIYEASVPDSWLEPGLTYRLKCLGLDYCGEIFMNGQPVGEFLGSHLPYEFDLTPYLGKEANVLRIVFELPPRWLGQFGYTSRMKEWKPRFNYTWDWTARLVQIGIWDSISIEATDGREIRNLRLTTDVSDAKGSISLSAEIPTGKKFSALISLTGPDGGLVREEVVRKLDGLRWDGLDVGLWWPNMLGNQPIYMLTVSLLDGDTEIDRVERRVGFRQIEWKPCEGAPENADPWICAVNGRPVFLQGVNWTPIRPNFADVTEDDYRKRLELYKDLGLNILRVWGGAFLEKECFYNLCDELGIMVWQEFPLSSSGVDNYPPDDEKSIGELAGIAESFIRRRQHHASLILWSGGNELINDDHTPCDSSHPMLARFERIVKELDPTRRFVPTSASGPTEWASAENYGKGIHWDVHGPWKAEGNLDKWGEYWEKDDALLRSETGSPGASPSEMIRWSAGDLDPMPPSHTNPLWRRASLWWIELGVFMEEFGREPSTLEEYVDWSRERQAQALSIAVKACKNRFPKCGGIIIWMGHDCFPCAANTSIVDFDGNPKPAALALKDIFRS